MKPKLTLKGRGLQLLAQREHSVSELRRKLLTHARQLQAAERLGREEASGVRSAGEGVDADSDAADLLAEVEGALQWLQTQGYQDESRFIESRIHARAGRYGNVRIRQELAQHGVALDAEMAQSLKATERDRAFEVWQRRFGELPTDAASRAKQMRFLASRGFSSETIRRVIQGGGDEFD